MIVCGALVVPPTSTIFTPQELAYRPVALDYGNGTAYAGLQSGLMRGDFAATVLQEPWITVAEKAGCRLVATTFFHGTWVATPHVSPDVYAALLRGITKAVHRINADKRRYVAYFMRDWAGHPEVDALRPEDFDLGRIQLKEPTRIPEHEARWAWEWMASWGPIDGAFDVAAQIDRGLEREAHELAAAVRVSVPVAGES